MHKTNKKPNQNKLFTHIYNIDPDLLMLIDSLNQQQWKKKEKANKIY